MTPLKVKLDMLRYCIEHGYDEDAENHLFDLLRALRLKGKPPESLTPEGKELQTYVEPV